MVPVEENLTQEILLRVASYDPDTGIFKRLKTFRRWKAGQVMGTPHCRGYIMTMVLGKNYLLHRLAFLYMTGDWPLDQVDHVSGVKTDNRWSNLRQVSPQENQKNLKMFKSNKSGVMGVYWHKAAKKWASCIRVNNKMIHLGVFDLISCAALARHEAEKKYGFHGLHGAYKIELPPCT